MTKEEMEKFYEEIEAGEAPPETLEPELSRAECEELMSRMDKYEEKAREAMQSWVKVYTSKDYPQDFLRSLIPKK